MRCIGKRNGCPADFWDGVFEDSRAEGFRDQLRAQTDAEHRLTADDGGTDIVDLAVNKRQVVVRRHHPAQKDKRSCLMQASFGSGRIRIGIIICDAVSLQCMTNPAQVFVRTVPESEDAHQDVIGSRRRRVAQPEND